MKSECRSCGHRIDASARLCPFCGADPDTGRKVDTAPIVEKHFPRRVEQQTGERALDFFRERQGLVITIFIVVVGLLAIGLHQMVTRRTLDESAEASGVPLTELADISDRASEAPQAKMPDLAFESEGDPRRVRTLMMEPGAVAPPAPAPSLTPASPVRPVTAPSVRRPAPRPAAPPSTTATTTTR